MKDKAYQMVKHQLSIVQDCRQMEHMANVFGRLAECHPAIEDRLYEALSVLRAAISDTELRAWRNVAMFALACTDEQQKEVRGLAYRRFYGVGKEIMSLTSDTGEIPSVWYGDDENELRAWLKEHFEGETDE